MRKKILMGIWLLIPVLLLAYHYGPGQSRLALDRAASKIAEARAREAKEDWQGAFQAWSDALTETPQSQTGPRFQLRLAQARTRMYTGELPEAIEDMQSLLTDIQRGHANRELEREVRRTLAGAQYYAGWLMRLESAPAEEWLLPVEEARQHFRLLAEETQDPRAVVNYKKNLEATIRLERMDLSELQGLPLPKFCSACKNVSQKCRSQRQSKGENKVEEKKDARGAGFNAVPKGGS
jgi:hypothetical protein